MSQVRETVYDVLQTCAEEESLDIGDLTGNEKLVDELGFRSLSLARILAVLEGMLGADPFSELVAVTSVRTVDDLVGAFEKAISTETHRVDEGSVDPQVEQGRQRAAARRRRTRQSTATG
jgi:acyl carrier protein